MELQLRPYQQNLVAELYEKIQKGYDRLGIFAGTGAGKTIISAQVCADACAQECRLLFLVHLDVLVEQTAKRLRDFGLSCGFIKSGYPEDRNALIQVASIQTLASRQWWRHWPADVVFFDEAHITLFSQVGQSILYQSHAQAIHLAMTATPQRLGRDQLGEHLQDFVAAPPPAQLQEMGFLAPMRYFSVPKEARADLSQIQIVGGDFDPGGLRNACNRPELIEKIVVEWLRLAPGKRTVAFCVDVDHADQVAIAFRAAGVPAASVSGDTKISERKKLYKALQRGHLLVLTSCNVISIGFDEPSVEVGLMLRPTQSSALHLQQVGRVMRISRQTGKQFGLILDQAGNLDRLGYPEDITEYFLPRKTEPSRKGRKHNGNTNGKKCPTCGAIHANFVQQCGCGYEFNLGRVCDLRSLVESYSAAQAHQIADERLLKSLFIELRCQVFAQGRHIALAEERFHELSGRQPKREWYLNSLGALNARKCSGLDLSAFWDYLGRCASHSRRGAEWQRDQFLLETGEESFSK